jgi:hypothetical protein
LNQSLRSSHPSSTHFDTLKQCHIASFQNLLLVTGFSKARERQILLFDPSSPVPLTSVSTIRVDFKTSPLMLIVDNYIVHVAGKGDTSLRWYEINDKLLAATTGAFSLPIAVAKLALIGFHDLDDEG